MLVGKPYENSSIIKLLSKVWRFTASQSKALDAVLIAACKRFYVATQRLVMKLYGVI